MYTVCGWLLHSIKIIPAVSWFLTHRTGFACAVGMRDTQQWQRRAPVASSPPLSSPIHIVLNFFFFLQDTRQSMNGGRGRYFRMRLYYVAATHPHTPYTYYLECHRAHSEGWLGGAVKAESWVVVFIIFNASAFMCLINDIGEVGTPSWLDQNSKLCQEDLATEVPFTLLRCALRHLISFEWAA